MAGRKLVGKGGIQLSAKVEGMDQLNRALKKLAKVEQHRLFAEALEDAAEPVRLDIVGRIPRSSTPGGTYGIGHAADNIVLAPGTDEKTGAPYVDIAPLKPFWYIRFEEFGGPSRPARAPFRKGARAAFQRAVAVFGSKVGALIERMV